MRREAPESFFYGPLVLLQDLAMHSSLDSSSRRCRLFSPVHDHDVVSGPIGPRRTRIFQSSGALASSNGTQRAKL
jgi:hypothetical protein